MLEINLKEYRCLCGKLLFKGCFSDGTIEVKCKNCRRISSFLGGEIRERQCSEMVES